MRTKYTLEVVHDDISDSVAYALVDGWRGGDYDQPWAIYDPRLLAHDIIEHINGPDHIGTCYDELQALGAILYVRPYIMDSVRYDILGILTAYEDEGTMWYDVPEVSFLCDDERDMLRTVAVQGTRLAAGETDSYGEGIPYTTYKQVLAVMSYGYLQAHAHYRTVNVNKMFEAIATEARVWQNNFVGEAYVGYTFGLTLDWHDNTCIIASEPNEWSTIDG